MIHPRYYEMLLEMVPEEYLREAKKQSMEKQSLAKQVKKGRLEYAERLVKLLFFGSISIFTLSMIPSRSESHALPMPAPVTSELDQQYLRNIEQTAKLELKLQHVAAATGYILDHLNSEQGSPALPTPRIVTSSADTSSEDTSGKDTSSGGIVAAQQTRRGNYNRVTLCKVSVPKANLRSGPGLTYAPLMTVGAGSELVVEEQRGDWLRVVTPTSERAWIAKEVVQQLN